MCTKNNPNRKLVLRYLVLIIFILNLISCAPEEAQISDIKVASLSLKEGEIHDFGYAPLNSINDVLITLENTGNKELTQLQSLNFSDGSAFSFIDDEYPGTGGTCSNTLQVGAICTIAIRFVPTTSGIWKEALKLEYLNGITSDSKSIVFRAIAGKIPKLEFIVEDNSFGIIESFDQKSKIVTVKNKGHLPLSDINYEIQKNGQIGYKGGSFPGIGGTCDSDLDGEEECKLVFNFKPIEDRTHSTTITAKFFDYVSEQESSINISGQSLDIIGKLFFNGILSANFGTVVEGSEFIQTITIRNEGYANATNLSFDFDSHPDYYIHDNRCPGVIEPTAQCEIDVSFRPQGPRYYVQNTTMKMLYNNSKVNTESDTINLTSYARSVATLEFADSEDLTTSLTNYSFGSQGQNSITKFILNLSNPANGSAPAREISLGALTPPFAIASENCNLALANGQDCEVEITYNPTDLGNHNQNFTVAYNNGSSTSSATLNLSGSSTPKGLLRITELNRFSPEENFGQKPIGGSFDYTYTIINEGVSPSTAITPPSLGTYLSYNGGFPGTGGTCPTTSTFTLNPGNSCTFTITYAPTGADNTISEALSIAYHNGMSTSSFDFYITRQALPPANLMISFDNGLTPIAETDFGNGSLTNKYIKKITLYNSGGFSAKNISYSFSSTDFAFNEAHPTRSLKGEVGDCPDSGGTLGPASSCDIYLKFTPSTLGAILQSFEVDYNNELLNTSLTHTLKGVGANLAYIDISPNDQIQGFYQMDHAAFPGGSSSQHFTITNNGQVAATSLNFSNIVQAFSSGAATTCTGTLNSGASCVFELVFTPSSKGAANSSPNISYHDGAQTQSYILIVQTLGVDPADLQVSMPLEEPYDFEMVETNRSGNLNFSLQNKGGFEVTVNSIISSNPLISVNSESCTSASVSAYLTCLVSLSFSPNDASVGSIVNSTITVNYYDGVVNKDLIYNVQGKAVPPNSIHQGWNKILAFGNNVHFSGANANDKKVVLEWKDMVVSQSYTISGYNVFRKSPEDDAFDYTNPLATNISIASKTYTDLTVETNTRYIYQVTPIVLGHTSAVTEEFASIEVYVPPDNMSFIHRRMGNKSLCEQLNKAMDKLDFNSCLYLGPGANEDNKMDIGHHLIYDRYELGLNGKAQIGQTPKATFNQGSLASQCSSNTVLIDDVYTDKRVPSRLEYNMVSRWPIGTNIDQTEDALISSEYCNTQSGTLEVNNANTSCVSEFGIYNLVGNSWEITSDRLLNAIGVQNDNEKLYPENTDFDGVNLVSMATQDISTTPCLNLALGHPVSKVASVCPDGSVDSSSLAIVTDYFWNPSSFGATFAQALVGGSYDSNTKSGRYTTAWVGATFQGGGRCALEIEAGLKFPED